MHWSHWFQKKRTCLVLFRPVINSQLFPKTQEIAIFFRLHLRKQQLENKFTTFMESFGKHREISITSSKPESERSFNDKNVAEIMENEYQVQKNVLDESLRQRYRQYELNPNLHKDHNYHLDQFLKNYTNSGELAF